MEARPMPAGKSHDAHEMKHAKSLDFSSLDFTSLDFSVCNRQNQVGVEVAAIEPCCER
jgi:hypothetical protein